MYTQLYQSLNSSSIAAGTSMRPIWRYGDGPIVSSIGSVRAGKI